MSVILFSIIFYLFQCYYQLTERVLDFVPRWSLKNYLAWIIVQNYEKFMRQRQVVVEMDMPSTGQTTTGFSPFLTV